MDHMLVVVIDPTQLVEPEWMEHEIDALRDYVASSPAADPDEPVLVPGDPERIAMRARLADGIPVDDTTWSQILETGERIGLPRSEAEALVAN